MELRHDWRAFNDVLFPNENAGSLASNGTQSRTAVLIEDKGNLVDGVFSSGAAYLDGEKPLDFGASIAAAHEVERTLVLSRRDLDRIVADAASHGSNYFAQLNSVRTKILESQKSPLIISRKHFVLDLFSGWLMKKILPARFQMLVFVDNRSSLKGDGSAVSNAQSGYRALVLTFNDGVLDQFFEPDFANVNGERLVEWRRDAELVGQYLENRYLLPTYAVFMFKDVWERMQESAQATTNKKGRPVSALSPWRLFVRYLDDGRAAVYPPSTAIKLLLATQRIMVYLGLH